MSGGSGGIGSFHGQGIGHLQAAEDGVVAVDDGDVHVRQGTYQLGGFDLFDAELLGIVLDVAHGGGQARAVLERDEALVLHEQKGTTFVGGVIGHGHDGSLLEVLQALALAGVDADVTANRITTLPRFTDATRWISIENIPVFSGKISILHQSAGSSTFANKSGKELIWRAMFPGNVAMISGMDAKHTNDELGNSFSYLDIVCKPGETKTAEACKYKLEEDEKFD